VVSSPRLPKRSPSPTFATTDNNVMHNNLGRSGFTRVGGEWQGKKDMLSLWIIAP
jgi:hypothetical protein